jgi:hypothetical protein
MVLFDFKQPGDVACMFLRECTSHAIGAFRDA